MVQEIEKGIDIDTVRDLEPGYHTVFRGKEDFPHIRKVVMESSSFVVPENSLEELDDIDDIPYFSFNIMKTKEGKRVLFRTNDVEIPALRFLRLTKLASIAICRRIDARSDESHLLPFGNILDGYRSVNYQYEYNEEEEDHFNFEQTGHILDVRLSTCDCGECGTELLFEERNDKWYWNGIRDLHLDAIDFYIMLRRIHESMDDHIALGDAYKYYDESYFFSIDSLDEIRQEPEFIEDRCTTDEITRYDILQGKDSQASPSPSPSSSPASFDS